MTNSPTSLILTIDIGSSSTRAMLFDSQATPVEGYIAQIKYEGDSTSSDGESGLEFDAELLFSATIEAIDQLLDQAGKMAADISAVAIDTFVTNILGLDDSDQVITPVYTYADTRNAEDAQSIRDELGSDGMAIIHDRTGCLIHSAYQPARFRWLARTQPDILTKAVRWVSIGEYLYGRLFGEWRVSYSVAAWTGLLNRHTLKWDGGSLSQLPIDVDHLSPLTDVNIPFRGLKSEWAERWPTLKDVAWFPAIGDGAAANIGSGCDQPDRVALTIGTTGAMRVVVGDQLSRVPDGLWLYRVDAQRALLGGATTEGGNLFAWLNDTFHLPSEDELERIIAAMEPASHGLTVLPFIAGERAPGWRDDARASLVGFTLDTEPADIVRAALEGIAYRFALIYKRIAPHLPQDKTNQIIASGGAVLSSPTWLQIMADVLGQPMSTLEEQEATSRGVALLALESLGIIASPSDLPPSTGKTYTPNMVRHAIYQTALEEQQRLYDLIVVE